jgi:cytochrome P450
LTIPAGSDPRKFENIGSDITTDRAPHFGFGGGMHHCIGRYVARLDMKEAFKALARRLTNMQIAPGAAFCLLVETLTQRYFQLVLLLTLKR